MEKRNNLRAEVVKSEARINLKDGGVSLPREWTNHFYEVVKQHNKYCVIIFSRHTVPKKGIEIQGLQRESVGRDVIHEKYPSKTWHEKLKNVPDESFEARNITEAGCSKASYETIKSEQVAKSYPDKDLVKSISKLKEKYNSEMGSTVKVSFSISVLNHLQLVCGHKRILNFITRLEVFRHYCVMPRVKYVQTLMVNLSSIIRMSHKSMI